MFLLHRLKLLARHLRPTHLDATSGPIRDGTFSMADDNKISFRFYVPPKEADVTQMQCHAFLSLLCFFLRLHKHSAIIVNVDVLLRSCCHTVSLLLQSFHPTAQSTRSTKVKIVVYFFHGNAEVCTAMDDIAEMLHSHGAALLPSSQTHEH